MLGERNFNPESLRAIYERNSIKSVESITCRYLGKIFLHLDGEHMPEAGQWIKKAIEADSRNGMRFFLGQDHALLGDFFKRQHDRSRARE